MNSVLVAHRLYDQRMSSVCQRMSSASAAYEQRMMNWCMRKVMMTFQENSSHPTSPASKPLSTTSPTAPQFSTVLQIVRLLCSINRRSVSATFPYVEIRASSTIIVGFTVCGVHVEVWPATLPTSTSADASSSSTNSAAAATAHHHNHPSVYRLGLCCPGTEGLVQPNPVIIVAVIMFWIVITVYDYQHVPLLMIIWSNE